MNMRCAACKNDIHLPETVGFRDTCPSCDAYLHSCVNCRFLVNRHCTEPSAEKVRDAEGQNFCDWFEVRDKVQSTGEKAGDKDAAEEMWKKLTKQKKES